MNSNRRTSETNLKRSSTENILSELPLAKIKKNYHNTKKKESTLPFTCKGSTTCAANTYEIFHNNAEPKSLPVLKKLLYNAISSNCENEFGKLFHDIQKNHKSMQEITEVIANAYEELIFKNVPLSDGMKQLVEKYLINLRFDYKESYLNTNREYAKTTDVADEVKKRNEMIAEITELHFTEYFDKEVDLKFLHLCTTIARHVHILKKQLRITYDKLPWEEMEFYLVCFVSSYTKCDEINLFYRAILNKQNLCFYLKNFVDILKQLNIKKEEINNKFNTLNLNKEQSERDQIKKKVIEYNKNFTTLYDDFKEIKNVYSLNKINYYIELALHKTHDKKLKSLAQERALQIMGEYLKYTLESPNLSEDISKIIISKFNWDIKRIITKLRDNLSHMYLSKECLILKKKNARKYPIDFENDLIKIKTTIANVLYKMKIEILQKFIKKNPENEIIEDFENLKRLFYNLDLTNAVVTLKIPEEFDEIKGLIESYKMEIENLTEDEQKKFNEIDEMLQHEKEITNINRCYESFISEFKVLVRAYSYLTNEKVFRSHALLWLNNTPPERYFCNKIAENILNLIFRIRNSIKLRINKTNFSKCDAYFDEIFAICEHKIGQIDNIKKYKDEFEKKIKEDEVQDKINEFLTALYKKLGDTYCIPVQEIFESFKALESVNKSRPLYDVDKFQYYLEKLSIKENTEYHKIFVNYFQKSQWRKLGKELTAVIKPYQELVKCLKKFFRDSKFENVKESIEKLCLNLDPSVQQNLKRVLNEISVEEEKKLEEHFKKTLDLLEYALAAETKEKYKNRFDKLDPIYETLLLDIFAFVEEKIECLSSNEYGSQFFLDKSGPTSLGKSLRNYLAHGTALINILPTNIKGVILSNASRIMKKHKDMIESKSPFVIDQPPLKIEYLNKCLEDNLQIIQNQQNMFTAIERDDIKAVQHFLDLGADRNGRNIYNWNVLHYASKNDSIDAFKFFSKNANLINAENMEGLKPLHISAQNGGLKILNYCLENKMIDVKNYFDKYGYTLLYRATNYKQKDTFELLFKFWNNGTNIYDYIENGTNLQNDMGVSLFMNDFENNFDLCLVKNKYVLEGTKHHISWLHVAVFLESLELIECLIHNGTNINQQSEDGSTPLHVAVIRNNMKAFKFLLNFKDINVNIKNEDGFTSLHWACCLSGKKAVECLLKVKDIDLNCTSNDNVTPLHLAASNGDENIVNILLSYKDEINVFCKDSYGRTPLIDAVFFGHSKIVEILLDFKETEINCADNEKWSPLHFAVCNGNNNIVEHLLKIATVEINCKNNNGWTLLHLAVYHKYKEIVEMLLRHDKIDINCENSKGRTPLHLAVIKGNIHLIEHLLKIATVEINCKDNIGWTPLHLAVTYEYKEIVEMLLSHDEIDINCKNSKGSTPLHLAVINGNIYLIEHLLKIATVEINCKDNIGWTPLHLAVTYEYKEIVEMLLRHNKVDINCEDNEGYTPSHLAVIKGNIHLVEYLLKMATVEVNCKNSDGLTLLVVAVFNDFKEIVEVLLKHDKIDINCESCVGWTPLHLAVEKGNNNVVEHLLKMTKIEVNCKNWNGYTPLHVAVQKGNKNLVEHLLKMTKVELNCKDNNGWTPLHFAVYYEYKEIAEILLKHDKIDINCVDSEGRTPLYFAILKGNNNIIEHLLKMTKTEVNCKKNNGCTPLHLAVQQGNNHIVEYLLKMTKTEVNCKNNDDWTPLHLAVYYEYKEIVEILLKHDKIDINCEDSEGRTPLHLAVEKGNYHLFEHLLKMTTVEVNCKDSNL